MIFHWLSVLSIKSFSKFLLFHCMPVWHITENSFAHKQPNRYDVSNASPVQILCRKPCTKSSFVRHIHIWGKQRRLAFELVAVDSYRLQFGCDYDLPYVPLQWTGLFVALMAILSGTFVASIAVHFGNAYRLWQTKPPIVWIGLESIVFGLVLIVTVS